MGTNQDDRVMCMHTLTFASSNMAANIHEESPVDRPLDSQPFHTNIDIHLERCRWEFDSQDISTKVLLLMNAMPTFEYKHDERLSNRLCMTRLVSNV